MGTMASQITSLTIVYSTVYSDADQRKHQSSASLAFVWGFHRGPVNSPHKWPVTRKMFPFDDVIMGAARFSQATSHSLNQCWLSSMKPCGGTRPQSSLFVLIHALISIRVQRNVLHYCTVSVRARVIPCDWANLPSIIVMAIHSAFKIQSKYSWWDERQEPIWSKLGCPRMTLTAPVIAMINVKVLTINSYHFGRQKQACLWCQFVINHAIHPQRTFWKHSTLALSHFWWVYLPYASVSLHWRFRSYASPVYILPDHIIHYSWCVSLVWWRTISFIYIGFCKIYWFVTASIYFWMVHLS